MNISSEWLLRRNECIDSVKFFYEHHKGDMHVVEAVERLIRDHYDEFDLELMNEWLKNLLYNILDDRSDVSQKDVISIGLQEIGYTLHFVYDDHKELAQRVMALANEFVEGSVDRGKVNSVQSELLKATVGARDRYGSIEDVTSPEAMYAHARIDAYSALSALLKAINFNRDKKKMARQVSKIPYYYVRILSKTTDKAKKEILKDVWMAVYTSLATRLAGGHDNVSGG